MEESNGNKRRGCTYNEGNGLQGTKSSVGSDRVLKSPIRKGKHQQDWVLLPKGISHTITVGHHENAQWFNLVLVRQ